MLNPPTDEMARKIQQLWMVFEAYGLQRPAAWRQRSEVEDMALAMWASLLGHLSPQDLDRAAHAYMVLPPADGKTRWWPQPGDLAALADSHNTMSGDEAWCHVMDLIQRHGRAPLQAGLDHPKGWIIERDKRFRPFAFAGLRAIGGWERASAAVRDGRTDGMRETFIGAYLQAAGETYRHLVRDGRLEERIGPSAEAACNEVARRLKDSTCLEDGPVPLKVEELVHLHDDPAIRDRLARAIRAVDGRRGLRTMATLEFHSFAVGQAKKAFISAWAQGERRQAAAAPTERQLGARDVRMLTDGVARPPTGR